MENIQYLTVTALTKYIKRKFDVDPHLRNIYVKGEISNFKRHTSGMMFFTVKDENARIAAIMFQNHARTLKFKPEDGMHVLIQGEVSVYEEYGQYRIYVKDMQPDGIGSLFLAFEQLKKKLAMKGMFDERYKKPLPPYPNTVGVITSPTGAAIRDIITTIRRRYPIANIMIYPALVQGENAAPSIVKAIRLANERKEADVLIVGRGGGSIEDLWPFNEEIVAKAIFESNIPIISAVGHETDTTIADLVADLRAPTPTGAAEMAVPKIDEILERILHRKIRLMQAIRRKVQAEREKLDGLERSYAFRFPQKLYEQKLEQLDRLVERKHRQMKTIVDRKTQLYRMMRQRLLLNHPQGKLQQAEKTFTETTKRLQFSFQTILKDKQKEFTGLIATLEALSPLKVMNRGYSIVYYGDEEKIVKSVHDVNKGDPLTVHVQDGTIHAKVEGRKEKENDKE